MKVDATAGTFGAAVAGAAEQLLRSYHAAAVRQLASPPAVPRVAPARARKPASRAARVLRLPVQALDRIRHGSSVDKTAGRA